MPRKKTHEEFVQDFNNIFKEEYEVVGNYINTKSPIAIKHKPCGYIFERNPNHLLSKKTCVCPICFPERITTVLIKGVNDIHSTNPKLFSMLLNKEDGYKYRENSNKSIYFICPDCNNKVLSCIYNVNKYGISCPICGDGYSYPEKFMYNLLSQLQIDFDYQWNPKWLKPYYYDFHFFIDENEYVIEMDGGLGHGKHSFKNNTDIKGLERFDKR